jgi:hypothetical protein
MRQRTSSTCRSSSAAGRMAQCTASTYLCPPCRTSSGSQQRSAPFSSTSL